MILHCKSLFRGEQLIELTADKVRHERRSLWGRHSFEAPLSEVSPTVESIEATSYGNYLTAFVCCVSIGLKLFPISEIGFETYFWIVPLAFLAVYFFALARIKSGSYTILRSTKETSRDIWILRSGREAEVDRFLVLLREQSQRK